MRRVRATVLWALWEVGLNGWALVPRLIAPSCCCWSGAGRPAGARPGPRGRRKSLVGTVAALAVFLVVGGVVVAGPTRPSDGPTARRAAMTDNDPSLMRVGADWPAYGGTYAGQRYSPLAQMNPENAGKLQRVWMIRTGDMPSAAQAEASTGPRPRR
jgi:quinoprotein glucose dehydrogenase